jgi:hypothetical protein
MLIEGVEESLRSCDLLSGAGGEPITFNLTDNLLFD